VPAQPGDYTFPDGRIVTASKPEKGTTVSSAGKPWFVPDSTRAPFSPKTIFLQFVIHFDLLARHPRAGGDPVLDFDFEDQRQNWMTSRAAVEKRFPPARG
jgi:hypothetical protein